MRYTWDGRSGRYRGADGRFLSGKVVRDAVDNVTDLASARMAALSQRLLDGNLSLADWQAQMMAEMKAAHVAAGGRLFAVYDDFQFEDTLAGYAAVGCAGPVALGALHALYQIESHDRIDGLVRRTLNAAAAVDVHVCGPFTILVSDGQ